MDTVITLGLLAVGLLSLFLGRRLFWLSVGVGGFVLGMALVQIFGKDWEPVSQLFAGLVLGIVCAVVSLYLQKPMAAMAGFVFGGAISVLITLALRYGPNSLDLLLSGQVDNDLWLIFVVAGLIFAVLTWMVFEKMLIGLSALIGAILVMSTLARFVPAAAPPPTVPVLTVGLVGLGIWVQARR